MSDKHFEYDVGLSFAGEQRDYVQNFANELTSRGVRVFFDDYEKAGLWGKDLYSHLADIYGNLCRYCILFASADYAAKVWPNHERQSAQARALEESREYILPVRLDDTPIPGLHKTIHYIDLRTTSLSELVHLTIDKLGNPQRSNYLPPEPDRLYDRLEVLEDPEAQEIVKSLAHSFLNVLQRMTADERDAVLALLCFGCPADLPDNVHINANLLHRATDNSVPKLKRLLGNLRSLGFECSIREAMEADEAHLEGELLGESYFFELNWVDLSNLSDYPALLVAHKMVDLATENYCEEHGNEFLARLDFSQLANATYSIDTHDVV